MFGHQAFIKEWLVDFFSEHFFKADINTIVADYKRVVKYTLGDPNPDTQHIEDLHALGYLPLVIRGLPEGSVVPLRVPTLTIENTHPKFFWLTNYVETLLSSELWPMYTAATIAREYRKILNKAAKATGGSLDFVQFQGHDFSMRGMMGVKAAIKTGMGHLTSFVGTDTIPAIQAMEYYYGANIETELVGTSIPATEHSIQCAYGDDLAYFKRTIMDVHPTGTVSIVADGYDFWKVLTDVLPNLSFDIKYRNSSTPGSKVVIRPDSGDPVDIICGTKEYSANGTPEEKGAIQVLWEVFGGSWNAEKYKELDPCIGLIYGDAITRDRAKEICERLKAKLFASTNVVFGIGSYTYQYNTRDTFGFAMKSTMCKIDGVEIPIFKDPKTDSGVKKSQKGRVAVLAHNQQGYVCFDQLHPVSPLNAADKLGLIYCDGDLYNIDTLVKIRARIASST